VAGHERDTELDELSATGRHGHEPTPFASARMSIGEGSAARDLIKVSFENPAVFMADRYASFQAASVAFESEHWAEMPVSGG
jgi:hypothetical protein